jgi:hypothetical protein
VTGFNPDAVLIRIGAMIAGPLGEAPALLALDTGATTSILSHALVKRLGYDETMPAEWRSFFSTSGEESVPLIRILRVRALNSFAEGLLVSVHDLPAEAALDGVLGLDFFRGRRLTIDFRAGQIELD